MCVCVCIYMYIYIYIYSYLNMRGEWPSGPASLISLTEVKYGCVRSETGWVTFQMNDQNSSLRRLSERTLK